MTPSAGDIPLPPPPGTAEMACPIRMPPNPRGAPCQAGTEPAPGCTHRPVAPPSWPGIRRLLSVLKAALTSAPCSPHALTSACAAPHPMPRSGGALGTEGPCCGHKVGYFHAKSPPAPAQTMFLLWRVRRRGRAERPAGHCRTLAAGQEVTGLSPDAPPWPLGSRSRGAAGVTRELCLGSGTWPILVAARCCWLPLLRATQVSPALQLSQPRGCPFRTHPQVVKCKPTRIGCVRHRESCRLSRRAPTSPQ